MRTTRIATFLFACVSACATPGTLITQLPAGARPVAIEISTQGDVYIAGSLASAYPNPVLTDCFVARYDPRANRLVYLTKFGAAATFTANGLALDATGAAYIVATTFASFPVTIPAPAPNSSGISRAIALKLSPDGQVVYSTFFTGGSPSVGNAIAVNAAGQAFLTGTTNAALSDPQFAATSGVAVSRTNSAFVAKLDGSGANLLLVERGIGGVAIALDAQENIYASGAFFLFNPADPTGPPVTASSFQPAAGFGSCSGGFTGSSPCSHQHIAKLDRTGASLKYGVYITGNLGSRPSSLAVDDQGNVYLSGLTPSSDYPVTPGAADSVYQDYPLSGSAQGLDPRLIVFQAPPEIGFVTELSSDASRLVFSTYLGGTPGQRPNNNIVSGILTRDWATKVRLFKNQIYVAGIAATVNFPGLENVPFRCLPSTYLLRVAADGRSVDLAHTAPIVDAKNTIADFGSYPLTASFAFDAQGLAYQIGLSEAVHRIDPTVPDSPSCVTDASTFQVTQTVAPGQVLSLFGTSLAGTAQAANLTTASLPTSLASATVDFDGIAGRLLYASSQQINVQVPYEIAGQTATTMNVRVAGASPTDPTGLKSSTQLAILPRRTSAFNNDLRPACVPNESADDWALARNADGTMNTCTNAAHNGSIVTLYLNGGGSPTSAGTTGTIATKATAIGLPVTVDLRQGGFSVGTVNVVNFSLEPGSVSGVWRLDLRIPGPLQGSARLQMAVTVGGMLLQNRLLELTVQP